jgi:SNF2 family DNA or RNA helicase
MLHALRQICNHPSDLDLEKWPGLKAPSVQPGDVQASGKTMLLHVLLEQILSQREKVVIFCQYLRSVTMIAAQIRTRFGIAPQTLVGDLSGNERALRVQEFQQSAGAGAIISTLGVGGCGITLHAAAHVIHFDRCYNPARENQGSDRVHRIGQAASCVFVHRIITRATFEERIDQILEQKSRLPGFAPPGEKWIAELDNAELQKLFAVNAPGGQLCEPQNYSAGAAKRRRVDEQAPVGIRKARSAGIL